MGAEKITLNNIILPQLNKASTLIEFNDAVSNLESFFNVHTFPLDQPILQKITEVFSSALIRLQDSLRPLHEIEEAPYNQFNTRVFRCFQTYGQTALNAREAIGLFLEACDKVPRPPCPFVPNPATSADGTIIYREINIVDLPQPFPAGEYRFENCEIYGPKEEKQRLSWSRVTHLTFVNHRGTNLHLRSADMLQVLICENNPHLRTLNERVMVIEGLPKLNRMVLINNPLLEEHDLQCFFDGIFIPRARKDFSFQLTLKNTPAFTEQLIRFLCDRGMEIASMEPPSPDQPKTYLISYAPSNPSQDRAPSSSPSPVPPASEPKRRSLLYGVLGVCVILGFFAPRFFQWAIRLKNSLMKA